MALCYGHTPLHNVHEALSFPLISFFSLYDVQALLMPDVQLPLANSLVFFIVTSRMTIPQEIT